MKDPINVPKKFRRSLRSALNQPYQILDRSGDKLMVRLTDTVHRGYSGICSIVDHKLVVDSRNKKFTNFVGSEQEVREHWKCVVL